MPGWISPDNVSSVLTGLRSRVRRLESYNAAPLYASSVLLTDVASVALTPGSFGFQANWTAAYSQSFTLAAPQTILCVYQQSFNASGGTANYVYVGQNVDSSTSQSGAVGVNANATPPAVSNAMLLLRFASLPAGVHTWYGVYKMNAGATTTYTTIAPQLDIYVIGS